MSSDSNGSHSSDSKTEKYFPSSSNVKRIRFTEPATLEVEYAGGVYRYSGVPRSVYDKACDAPSVGTFLNENVKRVYPYVRVK